MNYLSLDTEATGLEENCYLIQIAVLPIDVTAKRALTHLGREWMIQCPSFESLKPTLNPWVLENNVALIQKAHAEGLTREQFKTTLTEYLDSPEVQAVFNKERAIILGKSLSALDIPILHRYLGKAFMEKYFHHHTLDLTCVARFLVDCGLLPEGCQSTTKLVQHFKIRDNAMHTALSDASDMGEIYLKLLERQWGPPVPTKA